MRVSFRTLGCKLNQAETDELKKVLIQKGFAVVPWGAACNAVVVRGCAVTIDASQTTRALIRAAARAGAGAVVIAIGCVENAKLPEIDFVAKDNNDAIRYLEKLRNAKNLSRRQCATTDPTAKTADRTRGLIKIQTGCAYNCAYCVIPRFRGHTQSVTAKTIVDKIKTMARDGYQEITLTGVNIGLYRDAKLDLAGLLRKILAETKIARVRLGSLDPRLITSALINTYLTHPRLLPHWHLSLQSGSDKTLRNMRRGYTAKKYFAIVEKLRADNPLFSFTTDIIVGFPGETEEDFAATCTFIKQCEFAKVHVFPFSPRPGTPAAAFKSAVPDKTKKERTKKLIALSGLIAHRYAQKLVGQTRPILFESKKGGYWHGYTPEYIRVRYKNACNLANKIVEIKITEKSLEK